MIGDQKRQERVLEERNYDERTVPIISVRSAGVEYRRAALRYVVRGIGSILMAGLCFFGAIAAEESKIEALEGMAFWILMGAVGFFLLFCVYYVLALRVRAAAFVDGIDFGD